jgi:hypothetical protein
MLFVLSGPGESAASANSPGGQFSAGALIAADVSG